MALGWLTVLKWVPWDEVIRSAPKVAEGAKKLWRAAASKQPSLDSNIASSSDAGAEVSSPAQIQMQLQTAMTEIAELNKRILATSELLQTLAEQNAQLIQRIEVQRRWLRLLSIGVAVGLVLAIISLVVSPG